MGRNSAASFRVPHKNGTRQCNCEATGRLFGDAAIDMPKTRLMVIVISVGKSVVLQSAVQAKYYCVLNTNTYSINLPSK